jgi:hypothetical protein
MKIQFLREHHNRNEKAWKSDYLEEMRHGHQRQPNRSDEQEREDLRLKREFIEEIRSEGMFSRPQGTFKFGWSVSEFAEFNKLALTEPSTLNAFESLQAAASRDMAKITRAVHAGHVWWKPISKYHAPRLSWSEPQDLECDKIEA